MKRVREHSPKAGVLDQRTLVFRAKRLVLGIDVTNFNVGIYIAAPFDISAQDDLQASLNTLTSKPRTPVCSYPMSWNRRSIVVFFVERLFLDFFRVELGNDRENL